MIATTPKKKTLKRLAGFTYTSAIKKLRALRKTGARTYVIPGGTSAGKTFGILPLLIDLAAKEAGLSISVVSESIPHLKKGAIKDFKNIMTATRRWVDGRYNKTDRVYSFANGSYIEFFSADSEGRVRGPRRNILYINEANNISFDTYYQLAIRTDREIWLDYNPSNEFWTDTELGDDEDAVKLILTYKDNEALAPSIVKEIEKNRVKAFFDESLEGEALFSEANIKSSYWANWWKVYGLGLTGSLMGVIFQNWKQIDGIPVDARLLGYGQDFGFTADPAATIAVYSYGEKIIAHELIYQRGLLNTDLVKQYKATGVKPGLKIWADKAEPKSIKEIRRTGTKIIGAIKGPDSIKYGIAKVKEYEVYVTADSKNLINEKQSYKYKEDKLTGDFISIPEDKYNHLMDAERYALTRFNIK